MKSTLPDKSGNLERLKKKCAHNVPIVDEIY